MFARKWSAKTSRKVIEVIKERDVKNVFQFLVCLVAFGSVHDAAASVITPGENPGQYNIYVYIAENGSDLPYPPAGTVVGTGFLRYESLWLDQQVKAWDAWVECLDTAPSYEECDALEEAIDVSHDEETISFDMTDLLIDARFDMYGVSFSESDIKYWYMQLGSGGLVPYAVVIDMKQSNGNEIHWGAGGDDYVLELTLDGHYGWNDHGSCYAEHPNGSWTEDLCYEMDIDGVAASVQEPGMLVLFGLGLAGLGLTQRRKAALATGSTRRRTGPARGGWSAVRAR